MTNTSDEDEERDWTDEDEYEWGVYSALIGSGDGRPRGLVTGPIAYDGPDLRFDPKQDRKWQRRPVFDAPVSWWGETLPPDIRDGDFWNGRPWVAPVEEQQP